MSITIKTRKMLWGRSGNRCNFPGCRCELVMDATETDDESIIGEECHIVAREDNGPRGDSNLSSEQRDKYNNLILMCSVHHKIIDDQHNEYSVKKLSEMKKKHEEWVKNSLDYDGGKQRDDEVYLTYIDTWCELIDIDEWNNWTSFMLGSKHPRIWKKNDENLATLREWLLSRIWPSRYPEIELAFENFRLILEDLYSEFHRYSKDFGDSMLQLEKFYEIDRWDEELHHKLFNQYRYQVYLIEDLVVELTRAVNYICDVVRSNIISSFRVKEGRTLITYGPYGWESTYMTQAVQYCKNELIGTPYPGLNKFKRIRASRDFHFSVGDRATDPQFIEWHNH